MAEATRKRASRASQPITHHPLFPAIVALWFAALVGMGSFVLRTSLIESFVLAAHIDSLVPAAAPPLGTTARLLLAALLGLVGGTIGWVLAWSIARPKDVPAPPVFNFADLEEGLSIKMAPIEPELPMQEPEVATSSSLPSLPSPVLDPAALDATPEVEAQAPLPTAEAVIEPAEVPQPPAPTAAERIASAPLGDLSHVELIERLAIALKRREEWRDAAPIASPTVPEAAVQPASPVVPFPDLMDRGIPRPVQVVAPLRPAPHETEKALRNALAQLQRVSGGG